MNLIEKASKKNWRFFIWRFKKELYICSHKTIQVQQRNINIEIMVAGRDGRNAKRSAGSIFVLRKK